MSNLLGESLMSMASSDSFSKYSSSLEILQQKKLLGERLTGLKKKRKANSSKEGTIPAYLNVELVHPSASLKRKLSSDPPDFTENSLEYWAFKLKKHCVDGNIDWDDLALEADIRWFHENRNDIMEKIPTLSGRNKLSRSNKPSNSLLSPGPSVSQRDSAISSRLIRNKNSDWITYEMFILEDFVYVKFDLPDMIPGKDYTIYCNSQRLLIKGQRKPEADDGKSMIIHHCKESFEMELQLPIETDTTISEQTMQNGVLTVKFPVNRKASIWRKLDINHFNNIL